MHILFLTQIIPYPPDAGPRVKTWHVLRYLAGQGHNVTLASFIRPEEEQHVSKVEEVCDQVFTVPIHRSRIADIGYWLKSNFTGRPFLIERDDLKEMRDLVIHLVQSKQIDVIHADQLSMAQFAFKPDEIPSWPVTIFDAHNAVWTIVKRTQESATLPLKPVLALEAKRINRHEGQILAQLDYTLTVSEIDKEALLHTQVNGKQHLAEKIKVIPIAVDTQAIQPAQRNEQSKNILTMGTLHYPPNADGIRWFAKEIFPQIKKKLPNASLTIIGKNPPANLKQLAADNPGSIKVTGYVPDLNPYMDQAAIMVVPVRVGGGMRVRILEGFARAMPMVTTTVGLEGIDAQAGADILVEDTDADFANAVIELLNNSKLQNQLAENGRRLAETRYDWQAVLETLGSLYENIPRNR